MPAEFDKMRKAIKANLKKQFPKLSDDELESKSYAVATAQWKKSHGGKTPESAQNWHVMEFCAPITEFKKSETNEFIIRGIAISETTTRNNHKYIAEELERAAPSLTGKPLLVDHDNRVESIKGRVLNATFDNGSRSIKFEAQVMDDKIKEMISDGRINSVSIGAFAKDLVRDESSEAIIAKGLDFGELSLVAVPADENASFAMAMAHSFDLKESYLKEDHMADDSDGDEDGDEGYECKDCGKMFDTKAEMQKHYKSKHGKESINIPSNERRFDRMTEENTLQEMASLKEEVAKLREEKKLNSINEYKRLCAEKSVKEKDVTSASEETIKMLIEQLKEIQTPTKASEKIFKSQVTESYPEQVGAYVVERSAKGLAMWAKPDSKGRVSVKGW